MPQTLFLTGSTTLQGSKSLSAASLEAVGAALGELQESMTSWGVPPPKEGWRNWTGTYQDVLDQALASPSGMNAPHILKHVAPLPSFILDRKHPCVHMRDNVGEGAS